MDTAPLPRPIALEEFLPLVGDTLMVHCDPEPVPLHLVKAKPYANRIQLDRPPFLLIFRSAPDVLLMSDTYVMRGSGFGPDTIDIIQIAPPVDGEAGHYYQAVFN